MGIFLVVECKDTQVVQNSNWTKTDAIFTSNQWNEVSVRKKDQAFVFTINGQTVYEALAKELPGSAIGIYTSGISRLFLGSLVIKEFIASE